MVPDWSHPLALEVGRLQGLAGRCTLLVLNMLPKLGDQRILLAKVLLQLGCTWSISGHWGWQAEVEVGLRDGKRLAGLRELSFSARSRFRFPAYLYNNESSVRPLRHWMNKSFPRIN